MGNMVQAYVDAENRKLLVEEYRERLGSSYSRATLWWSILNKKAVNAFDADDFEKLSTQWNILMALNQNLEVVEFEDGSKANKLALESIYVDRTYKVLHASFGGPDAKTQEEKLDMINVYLSRFKTDALSEVVHKASCRVLKLHFNDLVNTGNGWVFDSRKTKESQTMRWILTAEDGISRLLSDLGREQVVINMNTADQESGDEEKEMLRVSKEQIFEFGVTDVATGKHYLCSAPSASSTRHVDFPFVKATSPQEVYDIWCLITGYHNIDELIEGVGSKKDGKLYVVFAKFKARIAQNGANSIDTGKHGSNLALSILRGAKVDFVADCHGTISKPFKRQGELGELIFEHPDGTVTSERV